MSEDPTNEDFATDEDLPPVLEARLEAGGGRLDKVLSDLFPALSRARVQALLAGGVVTRDGQPLGSASAKALPGLYAVALPAIISAIPQPEDIPLAVLFEDADLIVIDKPAGMAVHPAPGSETGTLVNALLHHCAASLSGIGGVARPGIVHRLDKHTSGVMVAAKTDAAHAGLSALFAAHDIERTYIALVRGAPQPEKGRIVSNLGRSTGDRKKMAVLRTGGREAITDYVVDQVFGAAPRKGSRPAAPPLASRVACTLHTGRTHQIRVHMASKGSPLLGDPVYGTGSPANPVRIAIAEAGLTRQALHAAILGFIHPVTGEALRFETAPPEDMRLLEQGLAAL
ncbi:RluA family pseudouridine synthase [Brevundimonas sp. UBA7664]|uniref:RluA family pseudouridine synthase n=1 Tax=Brevundimonas sp. UBA7664 TaxID=1946141 RepID=UPI0039C869DE